MAGRDPRVPAGLLLLPNRLSRKLPPPARRVGVLRSAIVLRERQQHRAALIVALRIAKTAPPRSRSRLVVIWSRLPRICWILLLTGPHCADWPLNSEKNRTVAALALGLRGDAVELALLLGRCFLVAADLLGFGRIAAAAAVDGGELRFQPLTHRIDGGARLRGRRRIDLCQGIAA